MNNLSLEPLNLTTDNNHKELHVPSSTPSLFMSPRRRTPSDDGRAINETRMLNLPDDIADTRDSMKSMIGRQSARLKVLKRVSAFNEGMASAVEIFSSDLRARLENDGYVGNTIDSKKSTNLAMTLTKNEGATILSAWTSVVASLEAYARYADNLAKQIKLGNHELNKILSSAEKELKALHESEESRWKYLCDAAKGETKATVRHKKCVADLEKAKARLSLLEDEGVSESVDETAAADALNSSQRPSFMPQSTKMTPSMNKAMGKMFSILPGGGEDVMEKVLNPEQRLAIAKRNLDDVAAKEAKGTESFEVARSVKQQAVVSYVTEAEVAEFKFKSDERHAWNEMQKSLEYLVKAISVFRESYHRNVMSSIESINKCRETATLDDVAQWTANVEKRVKDDRVRHAAKINDKSNSFEVGFSLGLQLEDSTDVKELVTLVITDENGSTTNGVSSIFSFVI